MFKLKVNVNIKLPLYNVCNFIMSHPRNICLGLLFLLIYEHGHRRDSLAASIPVLSIRCIIYPLQKKAGVNISMIFLPNIYNEGHQAPCCNYIVFHSKHYCGTPISIQYFLQNILP